MFLKLMGRLYALRRVANLSCFGECDPPDLKAKEIRISTKQTEQEELDTLIHEMTHACAWFFKEEFVTEFANSLSAALWRLGYRKCE